MSNTTTAAKPLPKPAPKPIARRPVRSECCDDDCTSGARNRYFLGKRLTPASFKLEQDYLVERRRLLNRAIHGWGVVYGYSIAMAEPEKYSREASTRLEIGPGLALDKLGRELLQTETLSLSASSVTMLEHPKGKNQQLRDPCWLLSVHYAERPMAPLDLKDPCSCERHEWDQVCETVHYTLRPLECSECCKPQPCELDCECGTGPCCERPEPRPAPEARPGEDKYPSEANREDIWPSSRLEGIRERDLHSSPEARLSRGGLEPAREERPPRPERPIVEPPSPRGGCRCLCDHLTGLKPGSDCAGLREVDSECGPIQVDLLNGVPLACVKLKKDDCGGWAFESVYDACGPRRLVKRNDLLFDLVRGCDLTYISAAGFGDWYRKEIPFKEFADGFGDRDKAQSGRVLTSRFWIEFSRPVRKETVRTDAFAITAIEAPERRDGWLSPQRVPIAGIVHGPEDPPGHVRRATLMVTARWLKDAIHGDYTIFDNQKTQIEVLARSGYFTDCNGQPVMGLVQGPRALPAASAVAGSDAVWVFVVGPKGVKP